MVLDMAQPPRKISPARNGPFLCKKIARRSEMFNYNVVYTVTMKIATTVAKWLRGFLGPQIGYCFETKTFWPPSQPKEAIKL